MPYKTLAYLSSKIKNNTNKIKSTSYKLCKIIKNKIKLNIYNYIIKLLKLKIIFKIL